MLPQRKHGLRTPHWQWCVTGFGRQKPLAAWLQPAAGERTIPD